MYAILKNSMHVQGFALTSKYLEIKDKIDNLDVRNDDIWICSFPKSGTTWTTEMVWLIENNLDYEEAKKQLVLRIPFLEAESISYYIRNLENDSDSIPTHIRNSLDFSTNQKPPRFFKTHLPFQLFPKQIQTFNKLPKIIYLVRDPRDVCVSYYHHWRTLEKDLDCSFEKFCDLFLTDQVLYQPYWDHVLTFWNLRHRPNILLLKYEDMQKDLKITIKQVAAFLNRSVDDQQVAKLADHLSFRNMKCNPAVNKEELVKLYRNQEVSTQTTEKLMRKGIVGDYRNEMSLDRIKRFEEWIKKKIEGSDYEIENLETVTRL